MRSHPLRPLLAILSAVLLAACGDDAQSALPPVPVERAAQQAQGPWAGIPEDSLYGATAVENLRVVPVVLDVERLPRGWEGMRIATLSDFQLGLWEDNEAVALAATTRAAALDVDLIALLGDYLHSGADTVALARVLAPLRGKKVFAVLGDRDIRGDSLEAAVTRTLAAQGIQVLRNSALPMTRNGSTAYVAGVDPDIVARGWGEQEYILATLGGGAATPLLLTHFPALASRIQEDRYRAILGGNTVCAEVEVQGTPRLSWLRTQALPGASVAEAPRLFRVEGAVMYVTCGLGYSFIPVRLGAPPEIALVTLRSTSADTAGAARARPAVADPAALDTILQRFQGTDSAAAAADTAG